MASCTAEVMVVVKDAGSPNTGQLLRSPGHAEEMPGVARVARCTGPIVAKVKVHRNSLPGRRRERIADLAVPPDMAFVAPIPVHGALERRGAVCATKMVTEVAPTATEGAGADAEVYSCKGMSVEEFFAASNGEWRSQRSSHNLAWAQFEAVTSDITIERRDLTDAEVEALCAANEVARDDVALALSMRWKGESDWDEDEVMEGSTVMAVVKDAGSPNTGRLLRSVGYAEEMPAVGTWEMTADGVFVLTTPYEMAAAEERIWFATKDLRMRVSQIRTSSGRGVVTASFSTEIRKLKVD